MITLDPLNFLESGWEWWLVCVGVRGGGHQVVSSRLPKATARISIKRTCRIRDVLQTVRHSGFMQFSWNSKKWALRTWVDEYFWCGNIEFEHLLEMIHVTSRLVGQTMVFISSFRFIFDLAADVAKTLIRHISCIYKTKLLEAYVTTTRRAFGKCRTSDCDIRNLSMPQKPDTGKLNCTSGPCFV